MSLHRVFTLGMITALGGGILRDVMIDSLPPATFSDWRLPSPLRQAVACSPFLGRKLYRLSGAITVLDAAGLSLFAVTGASKALEFGLGPAKPSSSAQ